MTIRALYLSCRISLLMVAFPAKNALLFSTKLFMLWYRAGIVALTVGRMLFLHNLIGLPSDSIIPSRLSSSLHLLIGRG
jgi:hypothetical protein